MTDAEKVLIVNMAVANGNLQIAIMRDDPPEIIKAAHHMSAAQNGLDVQLWNAQQLAGLINAAEQKMQANQAFYMGAANAR